MKLLIPILLALALPVQANDKVKHFAVGTVSSAFVGLKYSHRAGFLTGCGLGFAKEFYDSQYGKVEAADVLATCLGAAVGTGIAVRIDAKTAQISKTWRLR